MRDLENFWTAYWKIKETTIEYGQEVGAERLQ